MSKIIRPHHLANMPTSSAPSSNCMRYSDSCSLQHYRTIPPPPPRNGDEVTLCRCSPPPSPPAAAEIHGSTFVRFYNDVQLTRSYLLKSICLLTISSFTAGLLYFFFQHHWYYQPQPRSGDDVTFCSSRPPPPALANSPRAPVTVPDAILLSHRCCRYRCGVFSSFF